MFKMEDNLQAAFTIRYNQVSNKLKNKVSIKYKNDNYEVDALWDTGATKSCISHDVVQFLRLIPTGQMDVQTPSGQSTVNTYLVDLLLPNKVCVPNIMVCDSEIGNQGIGLLVGMDIINLGDMSISNCSRVTTFSFRMPSSGATDYVALSKTRAKIGTHGKGKRKHK